MSHQILQGGECVAGHGLTGGLNQPVVPVFGACDGLGLGPAAEFVLDCRPDERAWDLCNPAL